MNADGFTARRLARLVGLRLAGKFYPPSRTSVSPRSILLIRPDHVGDVLFLTPALHALRNALPAARLTLLVGPWGQAVVAGNADVDAVQVCRFPGFERQPKSHPLTPYQLLFRTARQLRTEDFDTAVILRFDHWWGAWLAAAAGIPRRVGHHVPMTQPFLTEALTYQPARHEVEQNASLLTALAPHADWTLGPTRFEIGTEAHRWANDWLQVHIPDPNQPLVAIHPGAGAPVKQWPVASWVEVASRLTGMCGAQILLTGAAAEQPLTESIAKGLAQPVLDATGQTSLNQLAALQARCALVMGSDSGPLHLATAVGTPSIHLYGPVSPGKFGPWGDPLQHVVLSSPWDCAPCDRLDWPAGELSQHQCMAALTVDRVTQTARALLHAHPSLPGVTYR